jgi:hypothetical protein
VKSFISEQQLLHYLRTSLPFIAKYGIHRGPQLDLIFRDMVEFQVEVLLKHDQTLREKAKPSRLSGTSYSVHLQLPSICGTSADPFHSHEGTIQSGYKDKI